MEALEFLGTEDKSTRLHTVERNILSTILLFDRKIVKVYVRGTLLNYYCWVQVIEGSPPAANLPSYFIPSKERIACYLFAT